MKNIFIAAMLLPVCAFAKTDYVVRKGDTLLKISDRTLGIENDTKDARRYQFAREIVAQNPDLKDPNVLTPGQTLVMPDHEDRQPSAAKKAKPATVTTEAETPAKAEPVAEKTEAAVTEKAEAPKAEEAKAEPAPKVEPVKVEPATPPPQSDTAAVSQEAKPAPAEPAHTEEHGEADFLIVQPRWQRTHFKVENKMTDQEFKLDSDMNNGLGLTYGFALGGSVHLVLQGGVDFVRLGHPKGEETIELDGRTQTLKSFGLGFEWHATHDLRVEMLGFYRDRMFALPTDDLDRYAIKVVGVPGAELALKYDLVHFSSSALGLGVAGEYFGTANKDGLKFKSVLDPVGSVYWETQGKGTNFGLTVYYAPNAQHSEAADQEVESLGVNLNLIFAL